MKFLVPNYNCLQKPLTKGLPPPDPRSLSSNEFVETPPPGTKFLGTPLVPALQKNHCYQIRGLSHVMVLDDISLCSEIYAKNINTFISVKPADSAC